MNKSVLKKISNELNNELKGNQKAFIFVVCKKYLDVKNFYNKENWLRRFLDFDEKISEKIYSILNEYDEEFHNLECIGWLYQYFISEEKERVFDNLKKNIKVEKEDIPYATQLFTPEWIVRYLVENSLGRFLSIQENFKYYIPCKNIDIVENRKLEEIKFIDPCQGAGHILVYAFELFYREYMKIGVSSKDAIFNILTKNLYGIDIDENACLITKLVLILKSASIFPKIFEENFIDEINIICIKNANHLSEREYGQIKIIFEDADEYGSLLRMPNITLPKEDEQIKNYLKQYKILHQKYDVVCTNPPYMGKKNINIKLSNFLKKEYPNTKSEMYAAFIERCLDFTEDSGYLAMITIHSWMFISSFKELREKILNNNTFINMLHTGAATFDDLSSFNALATAFVSKKDKIEIESCFVRLSDYYNFQDKKDNFKNKENYYYLNQKRFFEIPNSPFIYWISENIRNCFKKNKRLEEFYKAKQGLATGNNKEFVRFWYEVPYSEIVLNCKSTEEFWDSRKNICTI